MEPEPTIEPSVEPSLPPQQEGLRPESAEAVLTDGVYRIPLAPQQELAFVWQEVAGAEEYVAELALLLNEQEQMVESARVQSCRVAYAAQNLIAGRYVLRVRAMLGEEELCCMELQLELVQNGGGQGGFPGGFPGGGRPGGAGGAMGGMPEAEQGFHVTPGEALTSSHASGTKNMQRYDRVELQEESKAVERYAPAEGVEIAADGAFYVELREDALILTAAQTDGAATGSQGEAENTEKAEDTENTRKWTLNLRTLEVLRRSGIARLYLDAQVLDTDFALQGSVYGALRGQGYVSKDFEMCIDAGQLRISVAGEIYAANADGELTLLRG